MILAKAAVFLTVMSSLTATRLWSIPSWSNVTLLEVIWLATGIVMILVSAAMLPRLVTDYNLVALMSPKIRDAAHILAHAHIRREVVRLLQGVIMTSIGTYACASPPLIPGQQRVTTTGLVITLGLLSLGILTVLQSILDWRQRYTAERVLAAQLLGQAADKTVGPPGPVGPQGEVGGFGSTGATGPANGE